MRILHVVPTYIPAYRYGGPIESVHGLCKALAGLGEEVHVFTTSVDGPRDSPVPLDRAVDLDGVQVRYFRSRFLRRIYWSPDMLRALERELKGFDVVHLHSVFLWPTWAAARCARTAGVPYVVSPRGMLDKRLVSRKSRWLKEAWIQLLERRNLEEAAAIHVTSKAESDALAAFDFALRQVAVIANGVDLPAPGGATRSGSLLFLGRVNWKKGLDRLIGALARLPEARLVVAGNDEENYTGELRRLAQEAGVAARIEFVGPVYREDKWSLYRAAKCFVLPSLSENFGIAALEAMAAGCPVVLTPEVGLAEAVHESGAGIVAQGDPESLANAIASVLASETLRASMGGAGRQLAGGSFAWTGIARKMADLYAGVRAG